MTTIVLGGGVVGVTTAYYPAKAGRDVTVVDRHDGVAKETSFANAGLIAPGHAYTWASPKAMRRLGLCRYSQDLLQSLTRDEGLAYDRISAGFCTSVGTRPRSPGAGRR